MKRDINCDAYEETHKKLFQSKKEDYAEEYGKSLVKFYRSDKQYIDNSVKQT